MTTYSYESIINQTVSFDPVNDVLRFESTSPLALTLRVAGSDLVIASSRGTVTLRDTTLAELSLDNIRFSNGGALAVGDLLADDDDDADGNDIDFTDPALGGYANTPKLILGLDGDDSITSAGGGEAIIYGGNGRDEIDVTGARATIYGGSSAADTFDGADEITLGEGSFTVYGNGGADTVLFDDPTASGQRVVFYGGGGGDRFVGDGAIGSYLIDGQTENDAILVRDAAGAHTVYGGGGNDTIDLSRSTGDILIYGGRGTADTNDGGDSLIGHRGNLIAYLNTGGDAVTLDTEANHFAYINMGRGNDTLTATGSEGDFTILGGVENDVINLTGHNGNSTVYGGNTPADTADGGDTITGSTGGFDLIYGNAGADRITVNPGLGGGATVYGGLGNDTLTARPATGNADIQLYGNGDSNVFQIDFTNHTADIFIGDFAVGTNKLEVTLPGGNDAADMAISRQNDGTWLVVNGDVVNLLGFFGNFTATNISFGGGSKLLTNQGAAAASLTGTTSGDYFIAGNNGDTLIAGAGDDRLIGGNGNDRFGFDSANISRNDTVSGGNGADVIAIGSPFSVVTDDAFSGITSVETLVVGAGDFSTNGFILGSNASNAGIRTVDASGAGNTSLNLANMTTALSVSGGAGADAVNGTVHGDTITGAAGTDTIRGGHGADRLSGGAGNDVFVFNGLLNEGAAEGRDLITDFDAGTATGFADRLRFDADSAHYNLGNGDTMVTGAIVTSIVPAGAADTELVILRSVGTTTANMTSALDTLNQNVTGGHGVVDILFDTSKGHAVVYYDVNGGLAGGHVLLANLSNITTIAGMNNFGFEDVDFI